MARTLKRRSDQRDPSLDSSDGSPPTRRRRSSSDDSSDSSSDAETQTNTTAFSVDNLVKKLIRLALSSEYSRTPLRRSDISSKILTDPATSRQFKKVFALANEQLKNIFGMVLIELPSRERADLKSRRAATQTTAKAASSSSKSWILVSTLPAAYKTNAQIVPPTNADGSTAAEAQYTGIYTFIVSLIYLNSGSLAEAKLERYLKRTNAETFTPVGAVEKVLQRMTKEGYVEKRRDTSSGEEVVEWVVGPRGKIEVGVSGVQGFVKAMYGVNGAEQDNEDAQELAQKLRRSLGLKEQGRRIQVEGAEDAASDAGEQPPANEPKKKRGRPRKAAQNQEEEDDD